MLEANIPLGFATPHFFPSLVICVSPSIEPKETGACYVTLHRPVSSATATIIISTPTAHPPTTHNMCLTAEEREALDTEDVHVGIWLTVVERNVEGVCCHSRPCVDFHIQIRLFQNEAEGFIEKVNLIVVV